MLVKGRIQSIALERPVVIFSAFLDPIDSANAMYDMYRRASKHPWHSSYHTVHIMQGGTKD